MIKFQVMQTLFKVICILLILLLLEVVLFELRCREVIPPSFS